MAYMLFGVLTGCAPDYALVAGGQSPGMADGEGTEVVTQTDTIVVTQIPAVDILWMIDDSCSMNCVVGCHEENDALQIADQLESFMASLDQSGLDYHIGIITSDLASQGRLVFSDGRRWIDSTSPDPIGAFTRAAQSLGTSGSGSESGFGTTFLAHQEPEGVNGGFFRHAASLHTIVFSNEDDATPANVITEDAFTNWYGDLRPVAQRSFHSIVCPLSDIPMPDCGIGGERYLRATEAIGGVAYDIRSVVNPSIVEELGRQVAAPRSEFFLSRRPVPETIEVRALSPGAEQPVVYEPSHWTWFPVRNSLRLTEVDAPSAFSRVEIRYTVR